MSRQTYIYWILDTRPKTIAAGWHSGYPFYCGKSLRPKIRLQEHIKEANRRRSRKKDKRILACGPEHLRMYIVKIVPANGNWREQERRWIKILRFSFPKGNCNITDGGEGIDTFGPEYRQRQREIRNRLVLRAQVRAKNKRQGKLEHQKRKRTELIALRNYNQGRGSITC